MKLDWQKKINEAFYEQGNDFLIATMLVLDGMSVTPIKLQRKMKTGYSKTIRILDLLYDIGITNLGGFYWGEDAESSKPIRSILSVADKKKVIKFICSKTA